MLPVQHEPALQICTAAVKGAPSHRGQEPEAPENLLADLNSHAKQIQPCHCKKSMCLKLYCDCFASGQATMPRRYVLCPSTRLLAPYHVACMQSWGFLHSRRKAGIGLLTGALTLTAVPV